MAEVVTGDAVVLDVQIAQLPVRALSALIDIAVIVVGYLLGLMLWAATLTQFDSALSTAVLLIFTVVAIVGYPVVLETATRGSSVGKSRWAARWSPRRRRGLRSRRAPWRARVRMRGS